jgi:hypothetical protein
LKFASNVSDPILENLHVLHKSLSLLGKETGLCGSCALGRNNCSFDSDKDSCYARRSSPVHFTIRFEHRARLLFAIQLSEPSLYRKAPPVDALLRLTGGCTLWAKFGIYAHHSDSGLSLLPEARVAVSEVEAQIYYTSGRAWRSALALAVYFLDQRVERLIGRPFLVEFYVEESIRDPLPASFRT